MTFHHHSIHSSNSVIRGGFILNPGQIRCATSSPFNLYTMIINGKVHCFFEQSGTFKNEFIKLGIPAEDYDIQNNFGETDHVEDLFKAIEDAYDGKPSLFDRVGGEDLIVAFFPCIYFCATSQMAMYWGYTNYRKLSTKEATQQILARVNNREKYFGLAVKMLAVAKEKGIRLIMENPWSEQTYLKANFVIPPTIVDNNRMLRGDYYVKPTAYWFINCYPTHGFTEQQDKERKTIMKSKGASRSGICSEERSMISPDYARNFICDFIIGKEQQGTQLNLF